MGCGAVGRSVTKCKTVVKKFQKISGHVEYDKNKHLVAFIGILHFSAIRRCKTDIFVQEWLDLY